MTITPPRKWEKPVRHLDDGVDREKLRALMRDRHKTHADVARAIGKHTSCVNSKLTGRAPFFSRDIQAIKDLLHMTTAEAVETFFNKKLEG